MIINPKNGVDQLLFGMKQNHVEAIYGKPSKQFKDDDGNVIYLYNEQKLRLTFYEDEAFRLGYIITSNIQATLLGKAIMGKNVAEIKTELPFKTWEQEDFDSTENHFNESNWLILQSEYDSIIRVEIGAIIKDSDEFDWKFKG
ncbi:hypothetical protein WMW71_12090 [Flavobacterium buctense]|uniref:Uncharacterized protein n=1 Tax=Flavobacterium buctense TaxID=1648146 RepID=A0ABU9E6E8_9FLAO|nr:hypothetical protein [Flavobacterium buctense]